MGSVRSCDDTIAGTSSPSQVATRGPRVTSLHSVSSVPATFIAGRTAMNGGAPRAAGGPRGRRAPRPAPGGGAAPRPSRGGGGGTSGGPPPRRDLRVHHALQVEGVQPGGRRPRVPGQEDDDRVVPAGPAGI